MKTIISTLIITLIVAAAAFAQQPPINSVTPSYTYQGEYLNVSIVGDSRLSQGSYTTGRFNQGSSSVVDYNMTQGSSALAPGLVELLGSYYFNSTISTGYYDLLIGSSTLQDGLFVNPNAGGPGVVNGSLNLGNPKQGAPIAGYELTLTNTTTNATLISYTDADGLFEFRHLPVGTYELSATDITYPLIYEIGSRTAYIGQGIELNNDRLELVGIDELTELKDLNLYPTLFKDKLNLTYNLKVAAPVKIEVYDITGKMIYTVANNQQQAGSFRFELNTNKFNASGSYFVKVSVNGDSITRKVIKTQ